MVQPHPGAAAVSYLKDRPKLSKWESRFLSLAGWVIAAAMVILVYIMTVYAYAISVEVFSSEPAKGDAGR